MTKDFANNLNVFMRMRMESRESDLSDELIADVVKSFDGLLLKNKAAELEEARKLVEEACNEAMLTAFKVGFTEGTALSGFAR
ncbi:hypothetical protein NLX67_17220 [Domibacillus sp. A3M-37]|uniref:hypothetical protein n=1 Tax=Domibacillus sp. A3M-37 TaxID=2962037 RepID=UPI0020B843C6|nr:hypothetical protein [Domibacillus sp. A3M-37]MCP3764094.1 hypothetical protein [Domibacillus sp. A3M-37]